jgi:hypothetical protein
MASPPYMSSRSPPPLHHPKPTHPAYPPPEPPHTPAASTDSSPYSQAQRISQDGYMRFSSPPVGEPSSASASGINAYAAPAHPRQGYVHSPAPSAPRLGGYQNVGFNGWPGMNDATTQMGVQFGKSAVAAGQDYMEKNVSSGNGKGTDQLMTTIVYEVSPATADQDELLGHQFLRPEETPSHPLSMAA